MKDQANSYGYSTTEYPSTIDTIHKSKSESNYCQGIYNFG